MTDMHPRTAQLRALIAALPHPATPQGRHALDAKIAAELDVAPATVKSWRCKGKTARVIPAAKLFQLRIVAPTWQPAQGQ